MTAHARRAVTLAVAALLLAGCGSPRPAYINDAGRVEDGFTCPVDHAVVTWDGTITNYRDHRARLTVYVAPFDHAGDAASGKVLMTRVVDLGPDESAHIGGGGVRGGEGDYSNLSGGVAGCRVVNVVAVALEDSEL